MIGVIRGIRERGVSILMIEHLMRAIMSLSDRILVLNLGRELAARPAASGRERSQGDRSLSRRSQAVVARSGRRDGRAAAASRRTWKPAMAACRCCGASRSSVAAARHDDAGRRQRRRQDHDAARHHRQHPAVRAGRVLFRGEDVTQLPPHAKAERGLVLVPEGRQLFSEMSVEENLEMGAFSKRAAVAPRASGSSQVYTLFPRLQERRRQKAGTFSGGEQQMLAIGRGLMSDPEVLIIDELSLGLAPVAGADAGWQAHGAEGRPASRSCWSSRTCISRWRSATTLT